MTRTLGIVIPAFQPDVERLRSYVRAIDDRLSPATVRIEIDDPGPDVVDALADLPVAINAVPYRRGKGAAITAGFEALGTDLLAFVDADGSTPPASLAAVVDRVAEGDADLAVGSRRHPEADVSTHQTFVRRWLGDGFAWFARRLLEVDLHDFQCGAKALIQPAWERVRDHLYEPGFAWDVELVAIASALEFRIAEVPIAWEDRPGSTVDPIRTSLRLARATFLARHRAKRLRDSRLHSAIAARREDPEALIER